MFSQDKIRRFANLEFDKRMRTEEELVRQEHLVSEFRMYTLSAAILVFIFIVSLLIRNNRHKQKAFRILQEQKQETEIQKEKTEQALVELKATQVQLIQSEKMASLGEMASGVAHEIQNPLNFIKNFSEVDADLMTELESELEAGNLQNALFLAVDIKANLEKIGQHSERADAIVKGMMQHARNYKVRKETTDLNALVNQYLKSSYQEIWNKDKSFQCETKTDFDTTVGHINIITQDFGRLLCNLFNNAFYTLAEKKKKLGNAFVPQLLVKTRALTGRIEISVIDNGIGMPAEIIDKVFQPFFTTKPPGHGTGLGLSLAYDIIKAHGGEIRVSSENGIGSQFTVSLPVV
jgi:signal transduction histidine kinase